MAELEREDPEAAAFADRPTFDLGAAIAAYRQNMGEPPISFQQPQPAATEDPVVVSLRRAAEEESNRSPIARFFTRFAAAYGGRDPNAAEYANRERYLAAQERVQGRQIREREMGLREQAGKMNVLKESMAMLETLGHRPLSSEQTEDLLPHFDRMTSWVYGGTPYQGIDFKPIARAMLSGRITAKDVQGMMDGLNPTQARGVALAMNEDFSKGIALARQFQTDRESAFKTSALTKLQAGVSRGTGAMTPIPFDKAATVFGLDPNEARQLTGLEPEMLARFNIQAKPEAMKAVELKDVKEKAAATAEGTGRGEFAAKPQYSHTYKENRGIYRENKSGEENPQLVEDWSKEKPTTKDKLRLAYDLLVETRKEEEAALPKDEYGRIMNPPSPAVMEDRITKRYKANLRKFGLDKLIGDAPPAFRAPKVAEMEAALAKARANQDPKAPLSPAGLADAVHKILIEQGIDPNKPPVEAPARTTAPQGRAPKRADVAAAKQAAGGDGKKAAEILRSKGFNINLPVQD